MFLVEIVHVGVEKHGLNRSRCFQSNYVLNLPQISVFQNFHLNGICVSSPFVNVNQSLKKQFWRSIVEIERQGPVFQFFVNPLNRMGPDVSSLKICSFCFKMFTANEQSVDELRSLRELSGKILLYRMV